MPWLSSSQDTVEGSLDAALPDLAEIYFSVAIIKAEEPLRVYCGIRIELKNLNPTGPGDCCYSAGRLTERVATMLVIDIVVTLVLIFGFRCKNRCDSGLGDETIVNSIPV